MTEPNPFTNATQIGDFAGPGSYDIKYRANVGKRREQTLRDREGRCCESCGKSLSRYNPAPTCWACDGGVWRAPRKGEWGG